MTWCVVIEQAESGAHVVPIDDLRDHETVGPCWCRPFENADGVMVHNSMDGREFFERGERKAS